MKNKKSRKKFLKMQKKIRRADVPFRVSWSRLYKAIKNKKSPKITLQLVRIPNYLSD